MDASLQQVLTLGGSPMLRATAILVTIVSVAVNMYNATDANGSGSKHQAMQSSTMIVIGNYLICLIIQYLKTRISNLTISSIDFS